MANELLGDRKAIAAIITHYVAQVKAEADVELQVDTGLAAENIGILFDRYVNEVVLPSEAGHLQLDKIVAILEITVRRVEPLTVRRQGPAAAVSYNSQLATQVAITFWLEAKGINLENFRLLIEKDAELRSFLAEHLTWLTRLNIRYASSVFLLAQTWRLFHLLVADRIDA